VPPRFAYWTILVDGLPTASIDRSTAARLPVSGPPCGYPRIAPVSPRSTVPVVSRSGGPVVFGSREHAHVPISRAIEASSALPGLFPPVAIDGAHYVDGALNKTLHASVALDEGIALLLCVNPLVPFDASAAHVQGRAPDRLNEGGLPLVLGQTFRAIIHSRMRVGMESYRARYPDAGIVLFEPDREDADMFFANIFSYSQRRRLCATAFATTRANLRARRPALRAQLARHGIRMRDDRLDDATRDVGAALCDPRPIRADPHARKTVRSTARELGATLDQLEAWLARRVAAAR